MTNARPWYPISGMKLANTMVLVRWDWWEGTAAYIRIPDDAKGADIKRARKSSPYKWATFVGGEPVWLPKRGWSERPHCFQPIGPEPWPQPLPPPLPPLPDVIMGGIGNAKPKGTDDLARAASEYTGSEWWRDPGAIQHAPPGEVTLEMCEGRLLRALAHAGQREGLTIGVRTAGDALAAAMDEAAAAQAAGVPTSGYRPQLVQTPADIGDYTTAMGWWTALNPPEMWHQRREPWSLSAQQKIMLWRALPLPMTYSEIGEKLKFRRERAREVFIDGVEKAHRAANGRPVHRLFTQADQMAKLRGRNRAYAAKR